MTTNNAINKTTDSITFTTTSGIIGTTTNDNAAALSVGQLISSTVAFGSAISIPTTATPVNVTSISLTAGDWDVWGNVAFSIVNTTATYYAWVSSTSATQPDLSLVNFIPLLSALSGGIGVAAVQQRFSLSTTTVIYLTGQWAGTATVSGSGGIYARRRR